MLGYKIGLNDDKIYVAVPKKYFGKEAVTIVCDGVEKTVLAEDRASEATLKDKFNPDKNYTLYYFLWKE